MFNVNEAVDELIDDINTDYYESCYDAIYEELCNRVECGELTIEEAEMINEAAAEKYLTEGNAYNRVLKDNLDKREKIDRRIDAYKKLKANGYGVSTKRSFSNKIDDKINNLEMKRTDYTMRGYKDTYDPVVYRNKQNSFERSPNVSDFKELRRAKRDWMYAHGDRGLRPEEKYKEGRYLKAQQEINSKK